VDIHPVQPPWRRTLERRAEGQVLRGDDLIRGRRRQWTGPEVLRTAGTGERRSRGGVRCNQVVPPDRSWLHLLEGASPASLADIGTRLTWHVRPHQVYMADCSTGWSRSVTGPTAPSPSPTERRCFAASGKIPGQLHLGLPRTCKRSSAVVAAALACDVRDGAARRQAVEAGVPSARSQSSDQGRLTATRPTEDGAQLQDFVDVLAGQLVLSATSSVHLWDSGPGQL
jgi:hypothetical protein